MAASTGRMWWVARAAAGAASGLAAGGASVYWFTDRLPISHADAKPPRKPPAAAWYTEDMDKHTMSAAGRWSRAWNFDWDGRRPSTPSSTTEAAGQGSGAIRHLLLIRHGQYELNTEDHGLTALGKEQSHATGERLRLQAAGVKSDHYGTFKVVYKSIVSSTIKRAMETANIVSECLPGVPRHENDPLLAEGFPCLPHPGVEESEVSQFAAAQVPAEEAARIEAAFRKYVYRDVGPQSVEAAGETLSKRMLAKMPSQQTLSAWSPETQKGKKNQLAPVLPTVKMVEEHSYEIVVCHMNVIRYFVCRALQLPPEAWLRFRGDNCGITELIIHPNGKVSLGRFADTGHLRIEQTTFH